MKLEKSVEVKVLRGFGSDTAGYRKWRRMWVELGKKLAAMPEWMRDIVLEDVETAIRSRVAVMEMIQQHARKPL